MAKPKNIDDIIHDEVQLKIDTSIIVFSATAPYQVGSDWYQDVVFCDDKWASLFNEVNRGLDVFKIAEKLPDNVYKLLLPTPSTIILVKDKLNIENFYYFRGTKRATNSEWINFSHDERNKLPMTWLSFTPLIKQTFLNNDLNPLERESEIRMFFACTADFANDTTKDFLNKNIIPLNSMLHEFINAIKRNKLVFMSDDMPFDTYEFPKFGQEGTNGTIANIIDSKLSAVELRLTLPINKMYDCNC